MKNSPLLLSALLFAQAIIAITLYDKPDSAGPEDYKFMEQRLDNTKAYTLEVIRAMPEESFNFKPTDEVRSFNAQAFHIAYSLEWFNAQLNNKPIAWEPGDEDRLSKDEVIKYYEEQFDIIKMTIMKGQNDDQFTNGVIGLLDHNSHHRGQMITYLRMNDIAAPTYR